MSTTGTIEFKFKGKVYQTWYKVFGDLKGSVKTPLVTVHGGPGMTHHYMLIPVLFYDQLGNGQSSHALDQPKEFWTPELFMDELDNLLVQLGIREDFDLLGQSWGGMLAGHYASSRTPAGLHRLIIANSPASVSSYEVGTSSLLKQNFSQEFVARLRELEEQGKTDSEEYQQGTMLFYKKHVCTVDPWPEELVEGFRIMEENGNVYKTMMGTSEFNITGSLKGWSIVDALHNIRSPTLLISSPHDEVQEVAFIPFFLNVPKVKWVDIPSSTHLAMFEDPER
ncbi:Alpha/Beta hydrolase protein [Cyathus striatus]|nr:Alpha/Beta hydrolase protein [Cyathus striatus]